MAASLGDLAPSEKKKVARLIQQVVEERSLRERDQAALAEQVAEQRALNDREQAVLAEQNTRLAGDNARCAAKGWSEGAAF
jgi:Flp pilus assembly secretin CpaC